LNNTALIFSGQGAQYVGMGKDLAEGSNAARALFEQAGSILGDDFLTACFEGPDTTLTQTKYCQPALYVHGLAILAMVRESLPEFQFSASAGLSLGEFTAHAAAGTFSFEDGLRLVAARGTYMQEACEATNGGMLTILGATAEQAEQVAAESGLQVANYNCPGQIVLSGAKDLIPKATTSAQALGLKKIIPLNVAGAYHSSLMVSAQTKLQPHLAQTAITFPSIPVYSNVIGAPVKDEAAIRETLLAQVTGSVRWQSCIEAMIASGVTRFIEFGPGKVLAGHVKRINKEVPCLSIGNFADFEGGLNELR
jgi:[acyl-carrier-protein] S-malonyltransferase